MDSKTLDRSVESCLPPSRLLATICEAISRLSNKKRAKLASPGLTPVCETGIKTPFKFKQPVVGNQSATGYLVSFESELSYSK